MSLWPKRPRGERFSKDGALVLSRNHLALIQGLLDRPLGTAQSRDDLLRAALPHVRGHRDGLPSYWTVAKSVRTIPRSLIARRRIGNKVHFSLTQRARDVLSGKVAAYVTALGPYKTRTREEPGAGAA
jgi:hypothetical protein